MRSCAITLAPMQRSILTAVLWLGWSMTTLGAAQPGVPAKADNVMLAPRDTASRFVRVENLNFRELLPPPPAADSVAAAADLETVLQVQAARTSEQAEWAKTMAKDDVFLNRDVLGGWFVPDRLPVTAAFFKALVNDLQAVDVAAKQPFNRQRPYQVDTRVKPCVPLPASSSYPSGSGLQAFVWANLLADMVPAKRDALVARAHRAAWGRVIGGVHFPSDVVAGRRLAEPFLAACRDSPEFREKFEAVRKEVAAVMRRAE
jgi:acid phosphatase (class A)